MELKVAAICGESRVFRDDGLKLRREIERHWARAEVIRVDFENIRIASASFLDEGIAVLALIVPIDEIRRRLSVRNITEPDRQLLNHLVLSRAREREARAHTRPQGMTMGEHPPHGDGPGSGSRPGPDADYRGPPIGEITERVPQEELHRRFLAALEKAVLRTSRVTSKPLDVDLAPPLPGRVRVYMYNATRPPGGRPLGEHKVQLIVPGQKRGQRGSFDNSGGRIVLLIGYAAEEDVFVLWDAGVYTDFAWSRNVQVKAETIIQASAGKLATQERQLRPPKGQPIVEVVIAAKPRRLGEAIVRRMEITRERLIRE